MARSRFSSADPPQDRSPLARARSVLVAACALMLAGIEAPASAQSGSAATTVVGLLRDESGAPVAGATVTFVADAEPDVPALRDLLQPMAPAFATSDASGAFRMPAQRPGLLLATTPSGLGAVVERCWPGRAVRLLLRPMAEVALDDDREFTMWPALGANSDDRRHLPPCRGRALRLPAGRYEVWAAAHGGFVWRELSLRSGEQVRWQRPDGARQITAPEGAWVAPLGFPHVVLADAEHRTSQLFGDAARASLFVRRGLTDAAAPLDADPTSPQLQAVAAGGNDAIAWLLARSLRGTFRALACAPTAADGAVSLPDPTAVGDLWVVLTARGLAARAVPANLLRIAPNALQLDLEAGRSLRCRAVDAAGQPVAAAVITFEPLDRGPVLAIAYTNELGQADLGPIAGAGILRVDDSQHLPFALAIAAADRQPVELRLEPGLRIRGVVTLDDGTPLANVAVTLRDSQGRLRPPERTVASAADGSFVFDGIEPTAALLLFASQLRNGHTFSARLRILDSTAPSHLILRDEDPQIRPMDQGR